MLRKDAMIRAALIAHYSRMLKINKRNFVHPVVYQGIQHYVAHQALTRVFNKNDSPIIIEGLLHNIVCCNQGLLGYLIRKKNASTEYFID